MHKKLPLYSLLLSLSASLFSVQSMAQARLMADVGPCLGLETAVERYSCYEKQANAALAGGLGATAPAPSRAAPAPAAPAQPSGPAATPDLSVSANQSPADRFGFETRVVEKPPEKMADPVGPIDELNGVIADVSVIRKNLHRVTLENGQVWQQVNSDARMHLKAGQHVRIYPSKWGKDYRMNIEELKGYIQVSRIK